MINSSSLSESELKKYADEHIQYEYDMLLWSARVIALKTPFSNSGEIDWVVSNGLLNTFSIHARNLILFLYSREIGNKQLTDVGIENYVNQSDLSNSLPPISALLKEVITKANKQVAHLTTDRIKYEKGGKEWNFLNIAIENKKNIK